LMLTGVYNAWIQKSLDELSSLLPARYAKREASEGPLPSAAVYEYTVPGALDGTVLTIAEIAPVSGEYQAAFVDATTLLAGGAHAAAIDKLTYLTSESPMVAASYINLGIAYHETGDLDAAAEYLQIAIDLDGAANNPVAYNELGIIFRKLGRFEEAKASYQAALATSPEYHFAQRNLGILCDLYLAELECALEQYESLSAAVPDDDELAIWIADVSDRMNR